MKTVVFALLDKASPPSHSFVDGMLATEAAGDADISIRLLVSRAGGTQTSVSRYLGAVCAVKLFPRRGLGRLLNLIAAIRLIQYQASRERRRGRRLVLFVRNDPVLLLAAALMRGQVDKLVFQSSFPHEEYSGAAMKRWVARLLYRLGGLRVDVVTGVSPEGVERAQRLCPGARTGPHIPLLADMPIPSSVELKHPGDETDVRFLYAGTHRSGRDLETVLKGVVVAIERGAKARFCFVGASEEDRQRLLLVPGASALVEEGRLEILDPVPRGEMPSMMADMHVGISLIPPKPVYFESSPTKLAEYMGAGLAVLASRGIPMQEHFVQEAEGGVLVDWDAEAIAREILALSADRDQLARFRKNARCYAKKHMRYRSYLPDFRKLVG